MFKYPPCEWVTLRLSLSSLSLMRKPRTMRCMAVAALFSRSLSGPTRLGWNGLHTPQCTMIGHQYNVAIQVVICLCFREG